MPRLSTNAGLLTLGDVGYRVLGFVATVHMVRTLDPSGFGEINVGLSFITFWAADFGLSILGTHETAKPPSERSFDPSDLFLARIVLMLVLLPLALVVTEIVYAGELRSLVRLFLLTLLPYSMLLEWYHQGRRSYTALAASKLLTGAVYVGGLLLFVHGSEDIRLVPLVYLVSYVAAATLLFATKGGEDRILPRRFDARTILSLLKRGGTIGVASFLGLSVLGLPPIALERFHSSADAGVLSAAVKIVTIWLVVDRVFVALFLPAASRRFASNEIRDERTLDRLFSLVVVVGCVVGTSISIFAHGMMELVYGLSQEGSERIVATYVEPGSTALALLGWFVAATLLNSFFAYTLVASGRERAYFVASLRGGAIAVVIILALSYGWGLTGAAIAIVASELAMVAMTWLEFRRHFDARMLRPLVVSILLSAGALALSRAFDSPNIWLLPFYAILFSAVAFPLAGLRRSDLQWVRSR